MNPYYSLRSSDSISWSYLFNTLALLAVCGSLSEAFYYQLFMNELPCPLCQLQRVALTLAGIGMMLNMRFGSSAVHYAIILASAIGGAVASGRQILLHIAPGDPGYASTLFGLHFYTWGFISFVIMMLFCAVMLCIDRNNMTLLFKKTVSSVTTIVMVLFLTLSVANTITSVMVCKFGSCPDNPTEYLWKL